MRAKAIEFKAGCLVPGLGQSKNIESGNGVTIDVEGPWVVVARAGRTSYVWGGLLMPFEVEPEAKTVKR